MGMPYYVLESDGSGTMSGMPIRWTSCGGVLTVCNTPDICGANCIAPADWYYTISGSQLTLVITLIAGMEFTYTRR